MHKFTPLCFTGHVLSHSLITPNEHNSCELLSLGGHKNYNLNALKTAHFGTINYCKEKPNKHLVNWAIYLIIFLLAIWLLT